MMRRREFIRRRSDVAVRDTSTTAVGDPSADLHWNIIPTERVRGEIVRSVVPVTLSLATIFFTSAAVAAMSPYLSVPDPEDLALVCFLPTIFIALFFGSTAAVISSFASGLAAAYFVYPPHDSILIYDPRHAAELGFFLTLAVTGSKAISVLRDESRVPTKSLALDVPPQLLARADEVIE